MGPISRRRFLQAGAVLAAWAALGGAKPPKPRPTKPPRPTPTPTPTPVVAGAAFQPGVFSPTCFQV